MSLLAEAVVFMNLALIFYTWAVFSARKQGLHKKHLYIFGFGLLCDYLGTDLMLRYGMSTGYFPGWHTVTGVGSLCGMAFHFLLALVATLVRRAEAVNRVFHRVSLTIYTGWVVAFVSGAVAGIRASMH
ncbi:MAG TPA: HsmA family protein [Geomonas sp.]|nr:HsmA family protein [Geomonas sp.]